MTFRFLNKQETELSQKTIERNPLNTPDNSNTEQPNKSEAPEEKSVTFKQLELIDSIQRALVDEKYETPTPIQARTIPAALANRDVLGCAQTGTGKTAAFALPLLNKLGKPSRKANPNRPAALVLAPTRELAIQISDSFEAYGKHLKLRVSLVYGGVSQVHQVRILNRGAHIIIATPGRLMDLMNQGHIHLDQLEMFVLDEADRMLDMGFLPDIKRIISELPEERQSLFFSATLHPKIIKLSQTLLRDPVSVNVTPKKSSLKTIKQQVLFIDRSNKQQVLEKIIKAGDVERALVFTRTKRMADTVTKLLTRSGIKATAIHGNKSQNARQRALEAFRSKRVEVLVATDVAARGIDIDNITHVINYDLPVEPDAYVHRIGRTGRAGAEGIALSFCTSDEGRDLKAIERQIGHQLPVHPDFPAPKYKNGDEKSASKLRSRYRTRSGGQSGGSNSGSSNGGGSRRPGKKNYGSKDGANKSYKPKYKSGGSKKRSFTKKPGETISAEGNKGAEAKGVTSNTSDAKRSKRPAFKKTKFKKSTSQKNSTRPSTDVAGDERKPKKKRNKRQKPSHDRQPTNKTT